MVLPSFKFIKLRYANNSFLPKVPVKMIVGKIIVVKNLHKDFVITRVAACDVRIGKLKDRSGIIIESKNLTKVDFIILYL